MGMIKMTKKKIWNAGCVVLVLLLLCTVISFHVERLMRIPVEVVRGSQSEEEKAMQLARIPLSCYGEDPSTVFFVEEQEGLFGMELVAHTKEVWPIETAEDMALVPEQLDDDGLPLQIVRWSRVSPGGRRPGGRSRGRGEPDALRSQRGAAPGTEKTTAGNGCVSLCSAGFHGSGNLESLPPAEPGLQKRPCGRRDRTGLPGNFVGRSLDP